MRSVRARVAINKQLMKGGKQKTIQKQAKQAIQLGVNHTKSQHKITSQNELNKTENLLQENKSTGKIAQENESTNVNDKKKERKRQKPSYIEEVAPGFVCKTNKKYKFEKFGKKNK